MTPAELYFLLLGAAIGLVGGATLLHLVRGHPARPEVRVTITRNALPLRTVRPDTPGEPITLRRVTRGPGMAAMVPVATPLPVPIPGRPRVAVPMGADRPALPVPPVGHTIWDDVDPMVAVLGAETGPRPGTVALLERAAIRAPVAVARRTRARAAFTVPASPADPISAMAPANEPARAANAARAVGPSEAGIASGPCAGPRQRADERCLVASQARDRAEEAAIAARDARHDYDAAVQEAETASREADPRAIAARKEAARRTFHEATAKARERHHQEVAATVWLTEINRINHEGREALGVVAAAGRRMESLLPTIERLTLAADAARITAETATAACNDARIAVAACEEDHARGGAPTPAARPLDDGKGRDVVPGSREERPRAPTSQPAIYQLLQGDSAALARVVEAAANTPEEQSQLQLFLSGLVDAIVAGAIERAYLDFPTTHPFWGGLGQLESRQIAVGLAGLGYRFDGLGGFDAGRVPSARDLSLAVGYAGLDPRRMRHWPSEAESHELYRQVTVAADEFLASTAPDLSLGELVALLGRRSESLADLWNQWGRVRPLLMAASG